MKKNIAKLFSLLVVGILLVGVLCGITAYADTNDEIKIVYNNVQYGEKMKLMFAVDVPEGMSARVDICNENGTVLASTTQGEDEVIEGVTYKTFTSDLGVSAQNISTVVYAKAYLLDAEGNETGATDTQRYSVLEYLYKRLNVDDAATVTDAQRAMYNSCLEYAKYAEKVLTDTAVADRIENYVYVSVNGGTVDGDYSAGIYKKGTVLSKITSDLVAGENQKLVYSVGENSYTEEEIKAYVVNDHTVVNVSCEEVSAEPTLVLEITKDDFNSTSYAANNNTKTENGYSYTSYQVMTQSSTMQWKKSEGYITIASNEFVKLEMKSTAGTFTVTVGGATVSGTTSDGVTTYDLSGLTGEIKIAVGSATGKVDYINFYK